MLNYNHLYYFHVVVTEGSIAAAAERLGVTQPTVSEQVRTLERSLGSKLFDRQTSGWKLTEAGRIAFEQTSVMFRAGERLLDSLGQQPATMPSTLRVGICMQVSRSTSSDFLMPLFRLDDCLPSIRGGESMELIRDLRANELDLVLTESEPTDAMRRGLQVALVEMTPLVAVTAPGVTASRDWRELGLVTYRPTSTHRWEVEAFLDSRHLRPRTVGEADDPLLLAEAAARGGFVVIVPRSAARDAIRTNRLVVLEEVKPSHAGVFALYQDAESSELAKRAVEALIAEVQSHA